MKKLLLFVAVMAMIACNNQNDIPALTGISLNKTKIGLEVDDTYKLKVHYEPEEAAETAPEVAWESDNKKVATVNANGKVTAIAEGRATITATCGKFEAECEIIVTKPEDEPVPEVEIEDGALVKAVFTINDTDKKVQFSRGNLQFFKRSEELAFAEDQLEYLGEANEDINADYVGKIDLFGWGTGHRPDLFSRENSYATYTEWGQNPIINGGNVANKWRTLTKDEWEYVITKGCKLCKSIDIDDVRGILLIPSAFETPSGVTLEKTSFNAKEWKRIEAAGGVFLPAGGFRLETTIHEIGVTGDYWTSTYEDEQLAYNLWMSKSDGSVQISHCSRSVGCCVRLVKDVE